MSCVPRACLRLSINLVPKISIARGAKNSPQDSSGNCPASTSNACFNQRLAYLGFPRKKAKIGSAATGTADPDVQAYREKWAGNLEDCFVKNLENVQGLRRPRATGSYVAQGPAPLCPARSVRGISRSPAQPHRLIDRTVCVRQPAPRDYRRTAIRSTASRNGARSIKIL